MVIKSSAGGCVPFFGDYSHFKDLVWEEEIRQHEFKDKGRMDFVAHLINSQIEIGLG